MKDSNWAATYRARDDRRARPRGRRLSDQLAPLCVVADIGFQRAGKGLSEMTGVDIQAVAAQVRHVPVTEAPSLVGGEDVEVACCYLGITGAIEGHMVLMLPLPQAFDLVAMLLGEPQDEDISMSEMARSALGEAGNITSAFFLSALGDATQLLLSPTPPTVLLDMAGAVLDTVLADLGMEGEELIVIDTLFTQRDQKVDAVFLVLPRQRYLDLLLEKLPR